MGRKQTLRRLRKFNCKCPNADGTEYYVNLGYGSNIEEIEKKLQDRMKSAGKKRSIKFVELFYFPIDQTEEEWLRTKNACIEGPEPEDVIKRGDEDILIGYRRREGHTCEAAVTIITITIWQLVAVVAAEEAYWVLSNLRGVIETFKRPGTDGPPGGCQCETARGGEANSLGCGKAKCEPNCSQYTRKLKKNRGYKYRLKGSETKEKREKGEDGVKVLNERADEAAEEVQILTEDLFKEMTRYSKVAAACRVGNNAPEKRPFSGATLIHNKMVHPHTDDRNDGSGLACMFVFCSEQDRDSSPQIHTLLNYSLRKKKGRGVGFPLPHRSLHMELGAIEPHSSTACPTSEDGRDRRIGLVLYLHRFLNYPDHGGPLKKLRQKLKRISEKIEKWQESRMSHSVKQKMLNKYKELFEEAERGHTRMLQEHGEGDEDEREDEVAGPHGQEVQLEIEDEEPDDEEPEDEEAWFLRELQQKMKDTQEKMEKWQSSHTEQEKVEKCRKFLQDAKNYLRKRQQDQDEGEPHDLGAAQRGGGEVAGPHMQREGEQGGVKDLRCSTCRQSVTREAGYLRHVARGKCRKRGAEAKSSTPNPGGVQNEDPEEAEDGAEDDSEVDNGTVSECAICGYKNTARHLKRHIRIVHEKVKNYACEECEYRAGTRWDLDRHANRAHGKAKVWSCEKCDFTTEGYKQLRQHVKSDHEKEEKTCKYCGEEFQGKFNLDRHVKQVHQRVKDYACEECEYRAGTRWDLGLHVKQIHEKAKCKRCDFTAEGAKQLRQHVKNHHGKEERTCEYCGKEFLKKFNRQRHQKDKCSRRPRSTDPDMMEEVRTESFDESGNGNGNKEDERVCQYCRQQLSNRRNRDRHEEFRCPSRPRGRDQEGGGIRMQPAVGGPAGAGVRVFKCPLRSCGKEDTSWPRLYRHIWSRHARPSMGSSSRKAENHEEHWEKINDEVDAPEKEQERSDVDEEDV